MEVVGAMRKRSRASSSSPLPTIRCASAGLRDGEVVVLRRLEGRHAGGAAARASLDRRADCRPDPDQRALRPLQHARPGDGRRLFERYYQLLAAPELDEAEQEELAVHQMALAGRRQLGSTRRERYALEAVDRHLARERFATSAADLRRLPESAREGVRQILEGPE